MPKLFTWALELGERKHRDSFQLVSRAHKRDIGRNDRWWRKRHTRIQGYHRRYEIEGAFAHGDPCPVGVSEEAAMKLHYFPSLSRLEGSERAGGNL